MSYVSWSQQPNIHSLFSRLPNLMDNSSWIVIVARQCSKIWSIFAVALYYWHYLKVLFFLIQDIRSGVARILCRILKEQSLSVEIWQHQTICFNTRQQSVVDSGGICNFSSHFVRVGASQFSFLSNTFECLRICFRKLLSVIGQPNWCLNFFCRDAEIRKTDCLEPCLHEETWSTSWSIEPFTSGRSPTSIYPTLIRGILIVLLYFDAQRFCCGTGSPGCGEFLNNAFKWAKGQNMSW